MASQNLLIAQQEHLSNAAILFLKQSFPRRRESSWRMDSRLRGNDEFNVVLTKKLSSCSVSRDHIHCRSWPLTGETLTQRQKDNDLFEALAAVNERFSKLQDTLGSAMRHALILLGEQADSFLKVLSIYEKFGVLASVEEWQSARTARNLAAHDYQTDYDIVAEHFNTLHELRAALMLTAGRFARYCSEQLAIAPRTENFSKEFDEILRTLK